MNDDALTLPAAKKSKIVQDEEIGDNEDIVSRLPDSLLHHILSLLPTKDAVKTSILSTRWKDLWISVTNLNFECSTSFRKDQRWNNSFIHFLERVLLLHSSNIKTFRIYYTNYLDSNRVNSWIYSALRRQVQVLDLEFKSESELVLPFSLCRCDTLTELRVHSYCDLRFPAFILFSSLKTLHLGDSVRFSDNLSIHKLLMGLPVLEELNLSCRWENTRKVTINIPSLSMLTLDIHLPISEKECQVEVYAENLVNLSCKRTNKVDLVLVKVPLLVHADIVGSFLVYYPGEKKHASSLFNGIRFVKSLQIGGPTLTQISFANEKNPDLLPMFTNLTFLEVDLWLSRSSNVCEPLMCLFRNSPLLESFSIRQCYYLAGPLRRKPYPQCFISSLKTCRLSDFCGRKPELDFLKFLLKLSSLLEKIEINCADCACPVKLTDVHKLLESDSVPLASKNCVIEFI